MRCQPFCDVAVRFVSRRGWRIQQQRSLWTFREFAGLEDADDLVGLLANRPAKVNLIPFNPFEGNEFRCSDRRTIADFQGRLRERGLVATTRKTRGDDIDAACGQLAGKVRDRIRVRLGEKRKRTASE